MELDWFFINTGLMLAYGLQHSLLTTQKAVKILNSFLHEKLWNFFYSMVAVALLVVGFAFWQSSGVTIYALEGAWYWAMWGAFAFCVFMFFWCFKYTTSFWQWIGLAQLKSLITGKEGAAYYRVRTNGIKRYIRFPHHTFLALLFWCQPVMTLDTLWLAIFATVYTYIGTAHQDTRGRRLLGEQWIEYSKYTNLMHPSPVALWRDLTGKQREIVHAPERAF
ncbi:MAG: hypothetical protein RID91_20880 [Azospirillaceae bacterium]